MDFSLVCDWHFIRGDETVAIHAKGESSDRLHGLVIASAVANVFVGFIGILKNHFVTSANYPKNVQKSNELVL